MSSKILPVALLLALGAGAYGCQGNVLGQGSSGAASPGNSGNAGSS